jgi:hypothetical protein
MKGYALCAMCAAAAAALGSGPAAARDVQARDGVEPHRAAFAGAVLRLELGGRRARAPEARLGIGFNDYRRDPAGFLAASGGPRLPLEAGLAGGRLQWFVGGERASQLDRRLGASGSTRKTLFVVGGIAVGAAAAFLLLDGDGDGDDGPCPPGVEVCAQ